LFVLFFGLALLASAQQKTHLKAKLAPAEVKKIAKVAYTFGYSLVLMDVTRQVGTACPTPAGMCPRTFVLQPG
jgi:hypothetical protein